MSDNRAGRRWLPSREQELGLSKETLCIQADAQARLRRSHYHELHLISCEYYDGVLTLHGHVSSFHLKQVAQTEIRGLRGVEEINNRLEVAAAHNDGREGRSHDRRP